MGNIAAAATDTINVVVWLLSVIGASLFAVYSADTSVGRSCINILYKSAASVNDTPTGMQDKKRRFDTRRRAI